MTKENKYVVIGGQHKYYSVGLRPTLLGAKRLASKNIELWDNWYGFHVPSVYRIEDTVEIDGQYLPKEDAIPAACAYCDTINCIWGPEHGKVIWRTYAPEQRG